MPFESKPQAPISGLPLVLGAGIGSGAGALAVGPGSAGGADMVEVGADLDPHAAKNRVAAISLFVTLGSGEVVARAYQGPPRLPSATDRDSLRHAGWESRLEAVPSRVIVHGMRSRWLVAVVSLTLMMVVAAGLAHADKKPTPKKPAKPATQVEKKEELPPPVAEASAEENPLDSMPHVTGPKLVDLGHNAELDLPAGMTLFERATAQDLMKKMGNDAEAVVAAIIPPQGGGDWIIVIEADDVGYVSDSDADELDASAMLEQFKTGTIQQNKQRVTLGIPELFVDGWSERPHYLAMQHHLVWGLDAHDSSGKVINFFTRFLGRNGYLSVNLIDEPANIESSKKEAMSVLSAIRFRAGSRYADHVDGDRDSGLGLKALVLGGAGVVLAKKGGILIALLLFLKKGFIVVLAAAGGFFKWMFGRGKKTVAEPTPETPPAPPPDPGSSPPVG